MKGIHYFLLLLISTIVLGIISKYLLKADDLFVESLSDRLTKKQIIQVLTFQQKWEFVSYFLISILLLFKISIITAILDMGCYLFNYKIKYLKLFESVVKSQFVFLLVIIIKTLWFYFIVPNHSFDDLHYFYPLSALNIIGYEKIEPWYIYPLQVVNIFEIAYWIILAFMVDKILNVEGSKNTGMKIVASSYGFALLIWVVGVMFFTLNMT